MSDVARSTQPVEDSFVCAKPPTKICYSKSLASTTGQHSIWLSQTSIRVKNLRDWFPWRYLATSMLNKILSPYKCAGGFLAIRYLPDDYLAVLRLSLFRRFLSTVLGFRPTTLCASRFIYVYPKLYPDNFLWPWNVCASMFGILMHAQMEPFEVNLTAVGVWYLWGPIYFIASTSWCSLRICSLGRRCKRGCLDLPHLK